MIWMVLDEPSGRTVVDHGAVGIRNELDAAAQQRGLPVMLPLMDLQDSVAVNPAVIWGKFTDVLDQANQRYMASQYLLGRFSVQEILGERLYTGEWLVRLCFAPLSLDTSRGAAAVALKREYLKAVAKRLAIL